MLNNEVEPGKMLSPGFEWKQVSWFAQRGVQRFVGHGTPADRE